MKRKRTRTRRGPSVAKSSPPAATYLKPVGHVVVTAKQSLEKLPDDKHIHPRRPMRLIPDKAPEGKETNQNQPPDPEVNPNDFESGNERKKAN